MSCANVLSAPGVGVAASTPCASSSRYPPAAVTPRPGRLRDPKAMRADVRDGLLTLETARAAFGVALTDTLEVDPVATSALRG